MVRILFPEINLKDVKGVMIDLDNTLYLYDPCHKHALETCYDRFFDDKMSFIEFVRVYKEQRDEVKRILAPQGACRSRLFAFQHLLEIMGEKDSYVKAEMLDKIYWDSFIEVMFLEDEAKIFLEECKLKSLPISVVTDMISVIQVRKLQKLGITNFIDYLVSSEEVGKEKPNPIMFETALKKMNIENHNAIMIGDDEKKDVIGAKDCGIKSYQIRVSND